MTMYTVLLNNDTTATLDGSTINGVAEDFIGEMVSAMTKDENGNPIRVEGRLTEVLETREY